MQYTKPFLERSVFMSVLSHPLMDCDCSSACVAYKMDSLFKHQ